MVPHLFRGAPTNLPRPSKCQMEGESRTSSIGSRLSSLWSGGNSDSSGETDSGSWFGLVRRN